MKFHTYGPFPYEDRGDQSIRILFKPINEISEGLQRGRGVYIFTVRDNSGNTIPIYAGKSVRHGFGGRICAHLKKTRFKEEISKSGSTSIVLITAIDDAQEINAATLLTVHEAAMIGELERRLISLCFAENEDLLNWQGRSAHKSSPVARSLNLAASELNLFANRLVSEFTSQ